MIDYLVGDVRDRMADIADGSIGLVASSPPFIALRSYLPADHPDKHREIGSEPDPASFLDTLLELTAEWGRVLAPWGSIAIELGDTYAGSGGAGGDYNEGGLRDGQPLADGSGRRQRAADVAAGILAPTRRPGPEARDRIPGWPMAKCLALIPQAYALSLAYGRNVLSGEPSPAGQWRVRNVIVWHRPNPAVGALGDKVRPSTSYITVATRSAKRWFDLTAVRTHLRAPNAKNVPRAGTKLDLDGGRRGTMGDYDASMSAGAPPLDCWFDEHDTWTITTQPSKLAHYAMWPAKLAERLILSMCPEQVCAVCGEPRRRIERHERTFEADVRSSAGRSIAGQNGGLFGAEYNVERETLGWSDCGHGSFIPGRVLDPFCGTGTSLAVAELHGRDSIGIDIDERNRDLLEPRMAEVKRALFDTQPELPGQTSLFTAVVP